MSGDLRAWGDESARLSLPAPCYLLGAVIADSDSEASARDSMLALARKGRRLHYREMNRRDRERSLEAIAALRLPHLIVVSSPVEPKRQERARALCLERLAWTLHEAGVTGLILEARPASLMKRDRATIDSLRGKQALPRGLRISHDLPSAEPILWIADQVLGALGDYLAETSDLFELVRSQTTIDEIGLT